jgi:hypothetical protein
VSITTAWEDESSSGRMQGPDRGPVHGSDGGPDQGLVHGSDGPKEGPDFETEPDHGSNNGADERANRSQLNHNESIIPVIEKTVDAKAELNDNHSKENDTSTRLTIEESDPVQPWQFVPKPRGNTVITENEITESSSENRSSDKNKILEGKNENNEKKISKISKIKKNEKNLKNEKIIKGYELEKELILCLNNDTALNKLMMTIKLSQCRQIFDDLMEVDVMYNFLICVKKWCSVPLTPNPLFTPLTSAIDVNEEDRLSCNIVFKWFESICKVDSFRILKLLLSESQRGQLLIILNDSLDIYRKIFSADDINIVDMRVKDIKLLWQL